MCLLSSSPDVVQITLGFETKSVEDGDVSGDMPTLTVAHYPSCPIHQLQIILDIETNGAGVIMTTIMTTGTSITGGMVFRFCRSKKTGFDLSEYFTLEKNALS